MEHTLGARGRSSRSPGTSGSASGRASVGSGAGLGSRSARGEEVGVEAVLLALGVLLGIGRGTGTLGAGGNTAVGVVGLALAGARNLVAISDAATLSGVTYTKKQVRPENAEYEEAGTYTCWHTTARE